MSQRSIGPSLQKYRETIEDIVIDGIQAELSHSVSFHPKSVHKATETNTVAYIESRWPLKVPSDINIRR